MAKPFKLVEDKGVIQRKEYDALDYDEKLNYWQISKNEFKLITELDDDHFQKAFCYAQTKELEFHNKYMLFCSILDTFEEVSKKREIKLKDLDTEYHRNKRRLAD